MSIEKLEAQAAAWLVRSEAVDFSADDRARLEAWLARDPRHQAALVRLQAAWGRTEQFRRLRPLDGSVNEDLLTESILPSLHRSDRPSLDDDTSLRRLPRLWKRVLVATAAVFVLVAAGLAARALIKRFSWQSYATDVGGFERVTLPDGSTVHMNTDSRIRIRFTNLARKVSLARGEALFKVSPDARRPFSVEARDTTIRAVGTVFSVRLRQEKGVEVLVTQGQVSIDAPQRSQASSPKLSSGEVVEISGGELQLSKVDAPDAARRLAWMSGQLVFEQQSLAQIAAEFNRYNRRQIVIDDPEIAQLRMSAWFDATDPESFVTALERAYGVRSSQSGTGDAAVVVISAME